MKQINHIIFVIAMGSLLAGCGEGNQNTGINPESTPSSTQVSQPANKVEGLLTEAKAFYSGSGGVVDKAKAFELFTQAAKLGDSSAMFFLGVMYAQGENGPIDEQKALEWLEKSKAAGNGAPEQWIKDLKAKMAKEKKK